MLKILNATNRNGIETNRNPNSKSFTMRQAQEQAQEQTQELAQELAQKYY